MSAPHRSIWRLIVGLSAVNLMTQAFASATHFALAIWLLPEDYGIWGSATAFTALLTGLANLGETNRYLAERRKLRTSILWTFRVNFTLTSLCFLIALGVGYTGNNWPLAILIAGLGVNIPLFGLSNLLYVALVRERRPRSIAVGQLIASLCRFAVAVGIAASLGSVMAFLLATLAMSAGLVTFYAIALRKQSRSESHAHPEGVTHRSLSKWSAQALSSTFAAQADYMVLAIVAGPTLLGLYFFAYQATVAVTTVVSNPISKSILSELSNVDNSAIPEISASLMRAVLSLSSALVLAIVTLLPLASSLMGSSTWTNALPVIAVLIASIPARLMTPIVDASQLASGGIARNVGVNMADGFGTGVAALSGLSGDVLLTAAVIAGWKFTISAVRIFWCLRGIEDSYARTALTAMPLLFGICIVCSVGLSGAAGRSGWLIAAGTTLWFVSWTVHRARIAPRSLS